MRRSLVVLFASFACWVPPAMAQGGNGLYSPFPEPASTEQAQEYLQELGVQASATDLAEGRALDLSPVTVTGPSRRAGDGTAPGLSLLLGLLIPLLAAGTLARGAAAGASLTGGRS